MTARTGADVTAALEVTETLLQMVDDPDLHSDRLLLAVGLLAEVEHRRRQGRTAQARLDHRTTNVWAAVRDHVVDHGHRWAGHADQMARGLQIARDVAAEYPELGSRQRRVIWEARWKATERDVATMRRRPR